MAIVFFVSLSLILYHNIVYSVIINLISRLNKRTISYNSDHTPYVSLIVVSYNEEKVIDSKIRNSLSLEYPLDKIEFIFVSDASTDDTNKIISNYTREYNQVKLLKMERRGGKLSGCNEAFKIAKGEILVFTDTNTILDKNSLNELVKVIKNNDVACVCGKINYTNAYESGVSFSENFYWRFENMIKEKESNFFSITALNGGVYAVKKEDYIILNPIYSHDLCFPLLLGRKGKKSLFVKTANAYERSGSTTQDEVKRKKRMYGRIYHFFFRNLHLFFNPFNYNFKFFFMVFSHRTIRYLLPFLHILLFVSSLLLCRNNSFFKAVLIFQIVFIAVALFSRLMKTKQKILFLPYYYLLFLYTMLSGFLDFATNNIKPYWEIAQSTRG